MTTDLITAPFAGPTFDSTRPDPQQIPDTDPFDRMLMTADGTVTTLLEACTGEPIVTRTTRLAGPATPDRLSAIGGRWWHPDPRLLALEPAECVIARRVALRGAHRRVPYVLAESLVVPDRLPGAVGGCLRRTDASLGRLLAACNLETRRDILEIVVVRAGGAADDLDVAPNAMLVRRAYMIVAGRRPVAAVSEWLPPGRLAAVASAAWHPSPPAAAGAGLGGLGVEFVADL